MHPASLPDPSLVSAVPGISVVIPAHNAGVTIAATIASLVAQTCPDWEAIIVDDGSSDDTASVAQRAAAGDARIRLVRQRQRGVSAARNTGVTQARHDWLLFLDADDWLLPEALERLAARARESPEASLVYAGWEWVGIDGARIPRQQEYLESGLFPALARYCLFAIHACLVRRESVLAAGGFDTTLPTCEEWDLWQRIARSNAKFACVREVLALYRLRPDSASRDGRRLLTDGLEVIARGHRWDPRVRDPAPEHAAGEPAQQRAGASLMFLVWAAGLELGRGRDAVPLLEHLAAVREPRLDPEQIKWELLYALLLPSGRTLADWPSFWPLVEGELRRFLEALEAHSGARDLAGRCLRSLTNLIFDCVTERPLVLGSVRTLEVSVDAPIQTLATGPGIDRVRIDVVLGRRRLGGLDLPVFDGALPSEVIADAIANDFGWTILGEFFHSTLLRELLVTRADGTCAICRGELVLAEGLSVSDPALAAQVMAQAGWTLFLQELCAEPRWRAEQFYASEDDEAGPAAPIHTDGWITVELSGALPSVQLLAEELRVVPTIAGIALGAFALGGGPRYLSAQGLRAAIVFECGMELAVAAVREGILGQALEGAPLRARLARAASTRDVKTASTAARVGRRELGRIDTILSRRAALPVSLWPDIAGAARALGEFVALAQPLDRCWYAPDLIDPGLGDGGPAPGLGESEALSRGYGRGHFEELFASGSDPWDYESEYERTKYEQTLALVPDDVQAALELACAEGHFTERLATRVGQVVAADISRIALERARARCAAYPNIAYLPFDLVADAMPGAFDLIVCSEVLYYVGTREDLACVAAKLAAALVPGGRILLAHAHVLIDEPDRTGFAWALPFGAKVIGDVFAAVPNLSLEREIRTPQYRIQRFVHSPRDAIEAVEPALASAGPLTAVVAASLRDGGGLPPTPPAGRCLTERLPILTYHRVAPDGSDALAPYRITPEVFEEQLRYLKDAGYRSVALEEWRAAMVRHTPLSGRCVLLSFDDGTWDFAQFAWPLLRRYGFNATLFVVAGEVGGRNRWDDAYGEAIQLLDWDELRALRSDGVDIGAHSHSHRFLSSIPPVEIVRESVLSRRILMERLGHPVRAFAYPYGDHDRVVRHLVGASGFSFGLTCDHGRNGLWDDPMALKRVTIEGGDDFASFVRKLGA